MKLRMRLVKFFTVIITIIALASCNKQAIAKKSLENEIDSVSYALGLNMASQLRVSFDDVDKDLYMQGFKNGIDSTNILIDENLATNILRTFFKKRQVEERVKAQEEALKNAEKEFEGIKVASETFLAENKAKQDVKTTDSGLQYVILKEGTGEKPKSTSKVKVHYHGTLIDGTVFDSSVERGTPYETYANRVIRGWTEGLQLMPVGSKFKFFIPQDLAYGAFPHQGGKVRPFDALIFEVELLDIIE